MSAWRWRAATSTSHTPGMQVSGHPMTTLHGVSVQQDGTKADSAILCCVARADDKYMKILLLRPCLK